MFARATLNTVPAPLADSELDELLEALRSLRVGGDYWGAQPPLPDRPYVLVRIRDPRERRRWLRENALGEPVLCWLDRAARERAVPTAQSVAGQCDPWHLLDRASALVVDADDELALLGAIAGVPIQCARMGPFTALAGEQSHRPLRDLFRTYAVGTFSYFDPFSGEPISFARAMDYCGFWRQLIDSNRDIGGAIGFAFWKRRTVAPLLWRGAGTVPFLSGPHTVKQGERIAIWKSRTSPGVIAELGRRDARLVEVEDGFIRSAGLGADCVPPLSIVADRVGAHFDPGRPSELEQLLQNGSFSPGLLDRAHYLREVIVASGVSKYSTGRRPLKRRSRHRRHILVPGQVEDDRAVISGGLGLVSNLDLLRRVRANSPDAHIIYKPHPDIEAGHRAGMLPDELCLTAADEVVRNEPISALIEFVDEVHVNTSLAGFEALLREKPVTTYGAPFYAGWGLTCDIGRVPERRTAKRTLDELIAAVLLLYPRYLDPATGLPCPAEVLVRRLSEPSSTRRDGAIVRLRRLQGRCRRGLSVLGRWWGQ
jgi:capsular polysaccharide export protein